MLKNKRILLILILAAVLFLIPSICNAALIPATETNTTSTGKTVKWSYTLDDNNNIDQLVCSNVSEITGELTIPSTIDGHTVVQLSNTATYKTGAFEGCTGLTAVKIPNTVTKIGSNCFEGCSGLKSVTIPDSVTEICNEDVFKECTGLSSITIPDSVTKIGNYAFSNSGLSSIILSKNLTTIGDSVFYNCNGLKEINLPNSLVVIGSHAFENCTGIRTLTIPNNVTTIGNAAFNNCSGISSLKISENLTRLENSVFGKCKNLTSVEIPESVTTICGEYSWSGAFNECTSLEKVLIPDDVATIEENAFYKCTKLTIFGNDNQTSKRYAEENNINFDYIADWDKVDVGADVTSPVLESLKIQNSTLFEYDEGTQYYLASAGTNISIKATFSEEIYGKTSPTLIIKCGNGENISINNGVIQGSYIVYTYTIKNQDKGIISAVNMSGGDIADKVGNKVEKYICPELISENWSHYVFANGTDSNPSKQEENGNQQSTVTLSTIEITKAPTKTSYAEGSSFEKSGIVITAKYSDGTTKQIANYTVSPAGALKTTDTKVVISYTENGVTKTVEQKITVTPKVTTGNQNNGGNNNSNGGNQTKEPINQEKDPTIKEDSKLPQTGATVMIFVVIALIVVAVISKEKYVKYKDI